MAQTIAARPEDVAAARTIAAASGPPAGSGGDTPAAGAGPVRGEGQAIERGTVIDRYVALTRLGAGGMGVVYAAYDPELDRKVALKLLRARTGAGTEASVGRARLLREAQALARLSHPHVVAVHDVGTFGEQVWLAMEYVDGQTLGTWLKEQPRRWPEALRVMRDAGEGLAAAHAAGLVHRDLKPDNIMIGRDGRTRVMDFGLARADGEGPARAASSGFGRRAALREDVTPEGGVMGTPAYMSPEQWRGEQADARADQFAFCVTLWEAAFGERPFAGETFAALATAITEGEVRPPPRGRGVPAWLRRVLQRGLQVEPARRFPTMRALLEALARGQARGRKIRAGVALAALAAGAGAVPLWQRHDLAQREAACAAAGGEIAAVWDEAARVRLAQALGSTGLGYAAATVEKAVPWIDRWAAAWSAVRVQVCRAAEVEGTSSLEVNARARACLEERREALVGLLEALAEDPTSGVQRAVVAAASLPPVATCADPVALARRPALPDDPAELAQVEALRRELLRVQGQLAAGRWVDGFARAEALRARAAGLGDAPLVAEVDLELGKLAEKVFKVDDAIAALTRAFVAGAASGQDEVAAEAASMLVFVVGYVQARHEAALPWARAAEAFVRRLGKQDDMPGAQYLNSLASLHKSQGELELAVGLYERSLAIREAQLGPEHPTIAASLNNIANTRSALGQGEEAVALLERACSLSERALGSEHPFSVTLLSNLASAQSSRGALDAAQAAGERALQASERSFEPEHAQIGAVLTNLGQILEARGDQAGARRMFERALAINARNFGRESQHVADALGNLALVHQQQGALAEALAFETEALAIRTRIFGEDHLEAAWSLTGLAAIHRLGGDLTTARGLARRAVAIRERGDGGQELAMAQIGLAAIELAGGDVAAAREPATRALAGLERIVRADHPTLAEAQAVLAEVEQRSGALDRAQALAGRALALWTAAGGPEHWRLARALQVLGEVALARGQADEARALLERALGIAGANDRALAARIRFALARAVAAAEPGRARRLAAEALEQLQGLVEEAPERAEIAGWLARRTAE